MPNPTPTPNSLDTKALLAEVNKRIGLKDFRYGTAHSVKHGVNVTDVKQIVAWAIKQRDKQHAAQLDALQQTIEAGASKHYGCGCHQDAKFLNVSTITKAFNTARGKE